MDTFQPPQAVADQAELGLKLRDEKFTASDKPGTDVGVARARDLKNRKNLSLDTIGRMVSFFARHAGQVDRRDAGWENRAEPSKQWVAWLLWGGDEGQEWAERIWEQNRDKGDAEPEGMDKGGLPVLWPQGRGLGKLGPKIAKLLPKTSTVIHLWPGNLGIALSMEKPANEFFVFESEKQSRPVVLLSRMTDRQLERLMDMEWKTTDPDAVVEVQDSEPRSGLERLHRFLWDIQRKRGKDGPPAKLKQYRDRLKGVKVLLRDDPGAWLKEADGIEVESSLVIADPPPQENAYARALHKTLTEYPGKVVALWRGKRWFEDGFTGKATFGIRRPGGGPRKRFRVLANFDITRKESPFPGLPLSVTVDDEGVTIHGAENAEQLPERVASLGLTKGDYALELVPLAERLDLIVDAPAIIIPEPKVKALPGRQFDNVTDLFRWARPFVGKGLVIHNGTDRIESRDLAEIVKALESWNHGRVLLHPKSARIVDGWTAPLLAELLPPQVRPWCSVQKSTDPRMYAKQGWHQVTKGVVYHANKLDAHREFVSPEELERAAWAFLDQFRHLSVHHDGNVIGEARLRESAIAEVGYRTKAITNGVVEVAVGDWVAACFWPDPIWARILKGEFNAYSLEGSAKHVKVG
jgi:hypothetical protein